MSLPAPIPPPAALMSTGIDTPLLINTHGDNIDNNNDTLACLWGECQVIFKSHELLANHLSEDHVGWKRPEYYCDWKNCARQGVKCHSRFALMMHLRIHTGEKPFVCKFPGCDQAFGRQDALVRHKKADHVEGGSNAAATAAVQEDLKSLHHRKLESRQPTMTKRRRVFPQQQPLQFIRRGSLSEEDTASSSLTQIEKYKLAKAKLRYILRENEILNDEWTSIQKKLKKLQTERKVLLEVLMSNSNTPNTNPDGAGSTAVLAAHASATSTTTSAGLATITITTTTTTTIPTPTTIASVLSAHATRPSSHDADESMGEGDENDIFDMDTQDSLEFNEDDSDD